MLQVELYNVYEVGFDQSPIYTGGGRTFLFRRLTPYTEYTIILEACTGPDLCSRSEPVTLRTAETKPEMQPRPTIDFSNSTSVSLFWEKPSRANGKILKYEVKRRSSLASTVSQVSFLFNHVSL